MNPDVVSAIDELARAGILERKAAFIARRAAAGSLVSLHAALRVVPWAGSSLSRPRCDPREGRPSTGRSGRSRRRARAAAAAGCLAWLAAAARSIFALRERVCCWGSPAAADLLHRGQFTPLARSGAALLSRDCRLARWPCFRLGSLFSLALTSFAAWRGCPSRSARGLEGAPTPYLSWRSPDLRVLFSRSGRSWSLSIPSALRARGLVSGWLLIFGAPHCGSASIPAASRRDGARRLRALLAGSPGQRRVTLRAGIAPRPSRVLALRGVRPIGAGSRVFGDGALLSAADRTILPLSAPSWPS